MTPTDAPRPALGELARRAEIVKQCIAAEEGYWRRSHDFTSVEAHALAQATASAKAMLASMCSADSILQLVALASGGAAARTAFLAGYFDGNARGVWEPDLSADDVSDAATHAANQYGATATITEAK